MLYSMLLLPQLPALKLERYSSAIEQWIKDPNVRIVDATLTDTNRNQIPELNRVPGSLRVGGRSRARSTNGSGGRTSRSAKASRLRIDLTGAVVNSKRDRQSQIGQPTSVHGILCEMLADLPEVSFQMVPARRSRGRPMKPKAFTGTEVDTSFCVTTARFVQGSETHAIELSSDTAVLAWLHNDGTLRPPVVMIEPRAGQVGPAVALTAVAPATNAADSGAGEVVVKQSTGASIVEVADVVMAEAKQIPSENTSALNGAQARSVPTDAGGVEQIGWEDQEGGLALNRAQRKRKLVNYTEIDDETVGSAARNFNGNGDGALCGEARMDQSTDSIRLSETDSKEDPAEVAAADMIMEEQRMELRRRLQWTLDSMAAAPFELRRRLLHAKEVAARSNSRVSWKAFCSTCGMRFERVEGPLQLASHAGLHHLHDFLEYRCVEPLISGQGFLHVPFTRKSTASSAESPHHGQAVLQAIVRSLARTLCLSSTERISCGSSTAQPSGGPSLMQLYCLCLLQLTRLCRCRRAHELNPLLENFRTATSASELQRNVQIARKLVGTLADATLHRAMLDAEQRIARMVEAKRKAGADRIGNRMMPATTAHPIAMAVAIPAVTAQPGPSHSCMLSNIPREDVD